MIDGNEKITKDFLTKRIDAVACNMYGIAKNFCKDYAGALSNSTTTFEDAFMDCKNSYIYTFLNDIFDWAKSNFDYVEKAIQEYGQSQNILENFQNGQALQNEEQLVDCFIDIKLTLLYMFTLKFFDRYYKNISIDDFCELENDVENLDYCDRLCDIVDLLDKVAQNDE